MTNLDSVLKSRDNTLPTKICLVKARVFPVVMYGCESWTIKKAERQRINAFKLWCWRCPLRAPKNAKLLSEEASQTVMNRREMKGRGEKKTYTHLNAEFQRIARRDKKAFLSDQCKEIEENKNGEDWRCLHEN